MLQSAREVLVVEVGEEEAQVEAEDPEDYLAMVEVISMVSLEEDNTPKGVVISSIKEEPISSIKQEHGVASL